MSTHVLRIQNLKYELNGRVILDIPDFTVNSTGMLAILGPNGAGKSTLLRILAGLSRAPVGELSLHSGTEKFEGDSAIAALRSRTAFVFQNPYLWSGSVRRNLELGLRFRRLEEGEIRQRVDAIIEQLGLSSVQDREAGALSGGEAQRVALARALVLDPEILFLDEPSSNLDADAHAALREDLDRVARSRAGTIVLATHDRPDAFYLADRIAVLRDGQLVQSGTPAELFENPADPFIAGITGAELSFRGTVTESDRELLTIDVCGSHVVAVGTAEVGDGVKIAYRPEDLFLSSEFVAGGSARNHFRARITEIRSLGALVRIRLSGPADLVAIVTRAAAAELEITENSEVCVQVKATALHAFQV